MEILSDTTFRGKATFTNGFDVTGTSSVTFANTLETNIGRLRILSGPQLSIGKENLYFDDSGNVLTSQSINRYANYTKTVSFENPTIPSGCKKFMIDPSTAKNITTNKDAQAHDTMNINPNKPYMMQIRKVSTNELIDITLSGFCSESNSEFYFERSSTNEIPESYFRTTFIQVN